jgi:glycosyltransferase involved in cell wall biosynthesis
MIDDHFPGASCSIHGRSRVDESSERPVSPSPAGPDPVAAAIPALSLPADRTASPGPRIAILLCTYNGGSFLEQQLQSIQRQSWPNWQVVVSDDGSSDSTLDIVRRYQQAWGQERLRLYAGPRRGFAHNFMSLTCRADIDADAYAWCDQDDIWREDKLQVAVTWLRDIAAGTPALYLGRTELFSDVEQSLGYSPLFRRRPSFANALVQSIGGGNTMVFNRTACQLLRLSGSCQAIVSHDWWAYLLISGVGGQVRYDATPYVLYRQHGGNLVGANASWTARWVRLRMLFQGRFKNWNSINIEGLERLEQQLTPSNRQRLDTFKRLRHQGLMLRLFNLLRCGVYRQTLLGNIGLVVAVILKRL